MSLLKPTLQGPDEVKQYFIRRYEAFTQTKTTEIFSVMWLNRDKEFISFEPITFGLFDSVNFSFRQLVKDGLDKDAFFVIICHNHPSGILRPSSFDLLITEGLFENFKKVDIILLDHILIGIGEAISFVQQGYLKGTL